MMTDYKYGNKVIIKDGLFDGCNGIFFNMKDGMAEIEVFFKTKLIECPKNINNYFKDYLFNDNIPKKMTSVIIRINKKSLKKV